MRIMKILINFILFREFIVSTTAENVNCGQRTGVVGSIYGGSEIKRNSWPWIVALYNRPKENFFCAAAHCFQDKGKIKSIQPEFVLALLGKFDLSVASEFGSKISLVFDVILHPDWNFNDERYDADISIVVLSESVEYSRQIQPVCLPVQNYDEIVGVGSVVGWGKSEKTGSGVHESRPNELLVPAVNASHCYTRFSLLAAVSSNRAFCGGYDNEGRAPCLGDSGGGFYFRDHRTSTWIIKGIVSASIIDFDFGCDVYKFSLYTNVQRFIEWIDSVKKSTNQIVWKPVLFECEKEPNVIGAETDADCYNIYEGTTDRSLKIFPTFSNHPTIKSTVEIKSVVINLENLPRIIHGIGEAFINLQGLWIRGNLVSCLERSHLEKLHGLIRLEIAESNQIEFVAEDALWDLPMLRFLELFKCGITKLPKDFLKYSTKLEIFGASINKLTHIHKDFFKNNPELNTIYLQNNKLISINFDFTSLPKLNDIHLNSNDCIKERFTEGAPDASTVMSVRELQLILDRDCRQRLL